jgi:hypothetical protein
MTRLEVVNELAKELTGKNVCMSSMLEMITDKLATQKPIDTFGEPVFFILTPSEKLLAMLMLLLEDRLDGNITFSNDMYVMFNNMLHGNLEKFSNYSRDKVISMLGRLLNSPVDGLSKITEVIINKDIERLLNINNLSRINRQNECLEVLASDLVLHMNLGAVNLLTLLRVDESKFVLDFLLRNKLTKDSK